MIRLPTVPTSVAIVDAARKMTVPFSRFLLDFKRAIEENESSQEQIISDLQEQQTALEEIVSQLQTQQESIQAAFEAANNAQSSADNAGGGTTKSGSLALPVNLPLGGAWVNGPQIDLVDVIAGNLTISGTGPQQTEEVTIAPGDKTICYCEFRVVEIVAGVPTTVFTGTFDVVRLRSNYLPTVTNTSVSAVSEFSSARASTGAVSYRLDARNTSTTHSIGNLFLYLFTRRS